MLYSCYLSKGHKTMTEETTEENEAPRYPRVRIQEINKEAAQYFEAADNLDKNSPEARKLRRKGLDFLQSKAETYVIENDLDPERLNELPTSALVFLFSNLAKSKNPEIIRKDMFKALWNECDERIAQAEENKWLVPDKERAALLKYCRTAPRLIPFSGLSKECWSSFIPYYNQWGIELETHRRPPRAEKQVEIKPQETVVNGNPPLTDPLAPVRKKEYGADLVRGLKKNAPAYGIRFRRTDKKDDDFIRYDLYPWKKREEDRPTGSLTIHSDQKITLASQEYEHFVATAKMLKEAGHTEILLQRLSKDPDEAKAFAANMVVAGHIVDIKVEQPYKLEELQKYNPRISDIIRQQNPNGAQPIIARQPQTR